MRRSKMFVIAAVGVMLIAPAQAKESGSSSEDIVVTGQEAKSEQKVVCKKQVVTGTKFPARTCRTVKQWSAIREQHMRDAREMIDRALIETRRDR